MKCPVCKNEFNPDTGRRPKRFCSDNCKVKFWNAKKKVAKNNKPEKKAEIEQVRNPPVRNEIEQMIWEEEQKIFNSKNNKNVRN